MSSLINSQTTINSGTGMGPSHIVGIGQAFTVSGDYILDRESFYLQRVGTLTGNIVAKLYNVVGSPAPEGGGAIPTGSALATSNSVLASGITTTIVWNATPTDFVFSERYLLQDSSSYAFVLEYAGAQDTNNNLVFGSNNTANIRTNENILIKLFGDSYLEDGWYPYMPFGSDDLAYRVYGNTPGPVVGNKYPLPPFKNT